MKCFKAVFTFVAASMVCLAAPTFAQDKPEAYPITLKTEDVHEVAAWSVELNGLTLTGKDMIIVPIRCEKGITGAMVLGTGEFRFKPAEGEEIKGAFRGAMLRFNPADQAKLLPLDKMKVITDLAAYEMSKHLLDNVFKHCWHSGMNALIPDTSSFVANVYSKTHGDLLISTGPKQSIVHDFTKQKTLYQTK